MEASMLCYGCMGVDILFTVKTKTSKYTGPRSAWSDGYGYISQAGFCVCGASLAVHDDRRCPSLSIDLRATDARLPESLVGKRRLSFMERMGRIPFIRI